MQSVMFRAKTLSRTSLALSLCLLSSDSSLPSAAALFFLPR